MFNPSELESMPIELEKHFKELELRIMTDIVRRIKINSEITRSADWQIYRLNQLGESTDMIKKYIQEALNLSEKEVAHLYEDVIAQGYAREEQLYKTKGKPFIPFADNEPLQMLIGATIAQTNGELKNITQSLGFAQKINGKIEFKPIAEYYQKTLDGAILDITSGAFGYNTVLKRVVGELTNSGLRTVDYATGWSNRVTVASRRALMTGISQVTGKISEDNASQLDTDYFEVTRHNGARPTHQVWQGKVYTKEELGTICGLGTGAGLCGWNCYHNYHPFINGISERIYTDEQLDEMNAKENTPVAYNGKEYTTYQATQHQRKLETIMRADREKIKLLEVGGADETDIIIARAKYRTTSAEYARFSKAMDLPQQLERVRIDGLGGVGVGKYKTVDNKANSGIIKSEATILNSKSQLLKHEISDCYNTANPNFNQGKEYKINCQRCVSAYEARRRGIDVIAKPAKMDGTDTLPYMTNPKGWANVYENGVDNLDIPSGKSGAAIQNSICTKMLSYGDGARAIVRVQWQSGGGHVFIAEQIGAVTQFIDPQPGTRDVSFYFSKGMIKPSSTRLLRIDNKNFTDLIEECVE